MEVAAVEGEMALADWGVVEATWVVEEGAADSEVPRVGVVTEGAVMAAVFLVVDEEVRMVVGWEGVVMVPSTPWSWRMGGLAMYLRL